VLDRRSAGFVGCTACTVSHLPRARVVAESWRLHHPESQFFVLLIDGADWSCEGEPFEVVRPSELGLAPEELGARLGMYDAYEMSTTLKAQLFRVLLQRGAVAVVFTDPDACFYARVDDLAEAAVASGLVLIPHAVQPTPAHKRRYFPLSQVEYREATKGLFNGGMLAVGPRGGAFLDWWDGWLARDCLKEPAAGMWTDQSWLDWAPVYFDHVIIRDSSLDVAPWNLDERELGEVNDLPTVDCAPLRHFHFAAFDPRRPDVLAAYLEDVPTFARRRQPMPSDPVLSRLLHRYAERLLACGSEALRDRPYDYDTSAGGRPLGYRERAIYREAVLAAEALDNDAPPNPLDSSRIEDFDRLVDEPVSLRKLSPEAQTRLERLRHPGLSRRSAGRIGRRLWPAIRYALTEQSPPSINQTARVASDVVRSEY
jgi:hypothetical protein